MMPDACGHRIEQLRDNLESLESRRVELEESSSKDPAIPRIEDVQDAACRLVEVLDEYRSDDVSKLKALLRNLIPEIEVESREVVYPVIHLRWFLLMRIGWTRVYTIRTFGIRTPTCSKVQRWF